MCIAYLRKWALALWRGSIVGLLLILAGALRAGEPAPRLGLPSVPVPAENPSSVHKVALGKKLFFDTRLSGDGTVSCASCHQPARAFADGLPLARGINGLVGTRNTPTLINAAFNRLQFWDGRQTDLESQAVEPFFNRLEHGLQDELVLLQILRRDAKYTAAFRAVFQVAPAATGLPQVAQALATFERTLVAGNSSFDRYEYAGEKSALSAAAVRRTGAVQGQCAVRHMPLDRGTLCAVFR